MPDSSQKYCFKIKELAPENRPREKLIAQGPGRLKTSELLALILGAGTKKEDLLTMTTRLLKDYGEKNIIKEVQAKTLAKEFDIPLNKACQIVACFELGRRFFQKENQGKLIIRDSRDVFNYLVDMRGLIKEQVRGLYLNNHYQLIHEEIISSGLINASLIHPREVFQPAILQLAAAVIIAHNHPSGNLKPSPEDLVITKNLKKAGDILGISLLDHLIIADNKFISLI